tara:strand:- start:429 stop:749 length:321 start_codon:yes stop_codon:yes gene_type:complete
MYDQNFKNQAVIEVKNGSTIAAAARKFSISVFALRLWIKKYDEEMSRLVEPVNLEPVGSKTPQAQYGISLKSIKVIIDGASVTLRKNDVIRLMQIFDLVDERVEEG